MEDQNFDVTENDSWVSQPAPEPQPQPEPEPMPQPQPGFAPNFNPYMNQGPNPGPMPQQGVDPNANPYMNQGPMYGPGMGPAPYYQKKPFGAPNFPNDMSVKDWMLTQLVCFIPIVGLIMQIVWAAEGSTNKPVRKNYAIASLMWRVIGFGIYVVLMIILSVIFSLLGLY